MKKKWEVLLLPSFVGFLSFHIIPFFHSLTYAWVDNAFDKNFCGLDNFKELLKSNFFLLGTRNTCVFTIISVPLILIISYAVAVLLTFMVQRSAIICSTIILPYLLPSITIIMIWQSYFSSVPDFSSLILIFLWKNTGLIVILFTIALLAIPHEIFDSAQIDGASRIDILFHILLPNSVPMFLFAGILSFVNSLRIYRESYLLWGNYPDKSVYMIQNYLNNHFEKLNYQYVSSSASIFFLVVFSIIISLLWLEKKWSDQVW